MAPGADRVSLPMVPPIASSSIEPNLRRLHNEDWGFDSNCFVCEPRNGGGLQIPFHHDIGRDLVVATFTLGNQFSGAPSYVHGGVTLAVLDEAMAWAAIAIGGKFAVTTETTTRFHRPVLVDKTYSVEARLTAQTGEHIDSTAGHLRRRHGLRRSLRHLRRPRRSAGRPRNRGRPRDPAVDVPAMTTRHG